MGLNAHFNRPLGTNILHNMAVAAGAATVTTGIGLALAGGVIQQAIYRAGNGIASACIKHPTGCGRITAAVGLWDTVENLGLQAKLAIQTARGDPNAANTALELQFEQLDSAPGNTTFREIYETAAELIGKKNDEIAKVAKIISRLGPDTQIDEDGLIKFGMGVKPEDIEQVIQELQAIPNRTVWVSGSKIYVNSPTAKALEAVSKLQSAVKSGADESTLDELIYELAAATSHGSGNRVVLGAWKSHGGYIGEAVENGGIFFDTGDEVWKLLAESGVEPWRVNEAFLQRQLEAGVKNIDLVGEDIFAIINNSDERIRNSYRAREINWLLENANTYGYELIGNSWVKR